MQKIDGGFSYAEVSSSVEKADFTADGRRVVVRVVERTNLYFQVTEPNSPQYNGYQLRHTLTFNRGETGWTLAAIEAEIPPNAPAPATQFAPSLPAVKAAPNKTQSSIDAKTGSTNHKVTTSAYDYYAIADYANTYVWNPNPDYRVYSQDCTNFLSQAMKAGGWQPVDGDRTWDGAWYYGNWTWTTSYTWAGAENWYWFATYQTQRTWILPYVYDLGFADVLQLDFQQDNIIDHSMIVTMVNTVDVHLTYHSGPEHNKRLRHILDQYPNAWYYAHRT
ncbi:amidase domain-containing protein [Lentzea roselyniae]|uniref:amidase domain-containing protein n=1 Tax=Lentzea roselyniae TaxID=531940 RepID=UPI0031F9F147